MILIFILIKFFLVCSFTTSNVDELLTHMMSKHLSTMDFWNGYCEACDTNTVKTQHHCQNLLLEFKHLKDVHVMTVPELEQIRTKSSQQRRRSSHHDSEGYFFKDF